MADAQKRLLLFGGNVDIVLYDVDQTLGAVYFDQIQREARRLQRVFNFYDPESELSLLNKRKGGTCSGELLNVLKVALALCEETRGIYDVTHGHAFLARKLGKAPIQPGCSFRDVKISGRDVRFLHPEVQIDLGSIAKGFITDALLAYIRGFGVEAALVNARGDIAIYGPRKEFVDIRHPRKENGVLGTLQLENQAVATSGDYTQFVESFKQSHLLGESDLISVSVVAPSLMEADSIATVLFLLGSERSHTFLEKRPYVQALTIDESLMKRRYNGFTEVL